MGPFFCLCFAMGVSCIAGEAKSMEPQSARRRPAKLANKFNTCRHERGALNECRFHSPPLSDTLASDMTCPNFVSKLLSSTLCVSCLLAFSISGSAQKQKPAPATTPFGGVPQKSQAQQENFPAELLEQLSVIKAAALSDDY